MLLKSLSVRAMTMSYKKTVVRKLRKLSERDIANFNLANNPPPEEQAEIDKRIKRLTAKFRDSWSPMVRFVRSGGLDHCLDIADKRFMNERDGFTNNPIQTLNVYRLQ